MMDLRDLLLFLHILGAAIWIGGNVIAAYLFGQLARAGGAERGRGMEFMLTKLEPLGLVAVLLVVLPGVGLVLLEDQWRWTDTFVWFGIGAVVVAIIWQGFTRPKDQAVIDAVKNDDTDREAVLRSWYQTSWIPVAIILVGLWAMVTKLQF